ncbi:tetratricopeptide repeat protein [Candidatus Villigracilis affinis]|uniref:tetratricopeptide repeat protein n=1 Tax=Candidatus Villigracilis affinis TaxID=3140682 RepID=UPI001B3F0D4C|nr:tetratricopeptide repeat protein [Anaerolineales bacterium]MBL0346096.1 tetratricopeptide repeat protein [Anaerolineales bacterium]MBP8047627.1 tetratricopeptide repeat protein [Anaerolineales bacterium]
MPGREDIFQKAMNDGHSAAWDQEWDKACAAYRRALEEFPDHPKAMNSLGLALYQLGNFEEALQIYMSVVRLSPDDPIPMEKVSQLSERTGDLKTAVDAAMRAGDLFLQQRDTEKALENWVRVTNVNPENAVAHSRLAQVHERLGHVQQAVIEYLAIASIVQRAGNAEKTQEMVSKALSLLPNSPEAKQAQTSLKMGQLLPKPMRGKGGTGPIRMALVKQLQKPTASQSTSGLDPIAEARQKSLTQLAELLFEFSDDNPSAQEKRGLSAIMKGTGGLSLQQSEQTKAVLHLGLAIDAQTKGNESQAAEELEGALEAGFKHASLYFSLGLLRYKGNRLESAQRFLQNSVKHNDYALGTRLLLGQLLVKKSLYDEAALEYLEALKLADSITVPAEKADEVSQQYEPLIEAHQSQKDENILRKVCENINGLLMRPDWREQLHKTRDQMPKQEGEMIAPLADVILEAQSSSVLESMNRINQLARIGSLRSAMDEAYHAVQYAPTYLPLHALMGDLLVQENRDADAIAKYSIVAHVYSVRGEVMQATKLLRRIIQLAPMDLGSRNRLIDQLVARGQTDEAVREYLELAAIHYRLAELDLARKTYTTALRLVQQGNANRDWNAHIMQRMADIDLQRLDWKQALRIYEQLRSITPDDESTRRQLVELNLRMAQPDKAMGELENYITYLEGQGKNDLAISFIEEVMQEHPDQPILKRALAARLHYAGRTDEAIAILDVLGENLMQTGDKHGAQEVINQIILMNPPNVSDYRQLLIQMQSS